VKELRCAALEALLIADPAAKCAAVLALGAAAAPVDPGAQLAAPAGAAMPGRPARPRLVAPAQVAVRGAGTKSGRAALLHALAHIEFNAVNLALDAVWRFACLPADFYRDWMKVAAEEARHFTLLAERLAALGSRYGDFDAHDGLWEMADKTRDSALVRMALVPRVLEARGLDASPLVRAKLARAGDDESAAVIDVILRDEIGHVAIGNRWFRFLCAAEGREPAAVDAAVRSAHGAPTPRPPFNFDARRAAGFDADELAALAVDRSPADR
jgi:uncharacterized ferritin-like protein (DUF455 family)